MKAAMAPVVLPVFAGLVSPFGVGPKGALAALQADAGKTLNVAVGSSVSTLDPHMTGSIPDQAVLINIFDPLLKRDVEGNLIPNLATEWTAVEDNVWEIKLRDDVVFHNGEPFDADTVMWNIERVLDPANASPIQEFRTFDEVTVVDPTTVRIATIAPDPLVPAKLALYGGMMVPPRYIQEVGPEAFASNPVGTGAFEFVEWVKDDHLTLAANEDYWAGPPQLGKLVFRFIPDAAARIAALLSGQADLIDKVPAINTGAIEGNPDYRVDTASCTRIYYLSIAYPDGPTADKRVRQAISYAINTQLIIDKLLLRRGRQIAAPVSDTTFGYDPELAPYPYDPEKARALLAEAGYTDGFAIGFDTTPGLEQDLAEAIVGQLAEVGITAELAVLPEGEYEEKYSEGQLAPLWDNGYTLWQGDSIVLVDTFFHSGRPRARYHSPEFDALIEQAQATVDPVQREELMRQILRQLHEDAPWVYLLQANDIYGVSQKVTWTVPANQIMDLATADIAE